MNIYTVLGSNSVSYLSRISTQLPVILKWKRLCCRGLDCKRSMFKSFKLNPDVFFLLSDVHVTCQYSEDCVLPCSFTPSGREEIRWFRRDALIYSHPQGTNSHNELFMGRTSISAHGLSLGNASLILQRCILKDRGRYRCEVTKGEKMDSFVVLKVEGESLLSTQTARLRVFYSSYAPETFQRLNVFYLLKNLPLFLQPLSAQWISRLLVWAVLRSSSAPHAMFTLLLTSSGPRIRPFQWRNSNTQQEKWPTSRGCTSWRVDWRGWDSVTTSPTSVSSPRPMLHRRGPHRWRRQVWSSFIINKCLF